MGEGKISPFIYLSPGGTPEYDTEELESIQLVLRYGRAEPVVAVSPISDKQQKRPIATLTTLSYNIIAAEVLSRR